MFGGGGGGVCAISPYAMLCRGVESCACHSLPIFNLTQNGCSNFLRGARRIDQAYLWVYLIYNISISIALMALMLFYTAVSDLYHLKSRFPRLFHPCFFCSAAAHKIFLTFDRASSALAQSVAPQYCTHQKCSGFAILLMGSVVTSADCHRTSRS